VWIDDVHFCGSQTICSVTLIGGHDESNIEVRQNNCFVSVVTCLILDNFGFFF
jgi:hypothetical protein